MGLLSKRFIGLLILGIVALSLVLMCSLRPSRFAQHQELLLSRFKEVQNLQVLEAHFLAHQTLRDEGGFLNTNEFLIVAKGKALYGVNLEQVHIQQEEGRLVVYLPPVELQEMVMSPRDIEFLGVKKGWLTRQSEFEQYQRQALIRLEADLKRQANAPAYKERAQAQARRSLKQLLAATGLDVEVRFGNAPDTL